MPLEETVMREIGLGNHYNWYNGSGSCRYIRQKAADTLSDVIQKHHDNGEAIAPPDTALIQVLKRVASVGDDSDYSLTKTWQAASYIIAEHIHMANSDEVQRRESYERLKDYIEQNYIPNRGMHRFFHK